jgi:hypothetical protein
MELDLDDDRFLAAFEATALDAACFRHREHVRIGYLYLRHNDFDTALQRVAAGIRRLAAAAGVPGKYNETITVAFMALIAERLWEGGDHGGFPGFAEANADLMTMDVLYRYYPRDLLWSECARRSFILPPPADRAA